MRAVPLLLVLLAAACAPSPRNLGDPRGTWREQDMQGEPALGLAFEVPDAGPRGFSVLAANVGNVDLLRCDTALYKLCDAAQEKRVAERIARAKPDVALLSEVLAPGQCDELGPAAPAWHACHPEHRAAEPDQARRLLGPDYTIACEPRRGYECVAVRREFAKLRGCDDGALCRGLLRSAEALPGCDDGFTLSMATVEVDGVALDVGVAHPPSGFTAEAQACRRDFLPAVLAPRGAPGSLRQQPRALVGGDFNLDPYRHGTDADGTYFLAQVRTSASAAGGPLLLHSGLQEHDPPYWTAPLTRATWDHVVSEGLTGRCVTLGAHEGYPPLDMAVGPELQRLDHLAQYCVLSLASP